MCTVRALGLEPTQCYTDINSERNLLGLKGTEATIIKFFGQKQKSPMHQMAFDKAERTRKGLTGLLEAAFAATPANSSSRDPEISTGRADIRDDDP